MENQFGKARGILLLVLGLCYVGMGVFVIMKHWFLVKISESTAWPLGILLAAYGLFRVYRAYVTLKKETP
jgi:hypothetical protein